MAVGPSHPQRMPQTAITAISTRRCLRLRVCLGSGSDSKYELIEPTSTILVTRVILGSVGDGSRAEPRREAPENSDRIQDIEPRLIASDYPGRPVIRAGRGSCPEQCA